jgi:gluconolactonase
MVVGSGRVFATQDPKTPGGPDGMKVDRDGRVYVAVAQGVWVYQADGRLLGIIGLNERPSNLAWRGPDGSTLAITAVDKVYQVRLKTSGVLPPLRPGA